MEFLDYQIEVKEVDQAGVFEGYASVFKNVDLQRDIVDPGAFTRTLKETRGRVPILMAHMGSRIVGFGTDAEQDQRGLKVAGEFTLESDDGRNAYAIAKHASAKGHKLGLSIGYFIPDDGAEWDEKRGIRHLKDIDLMEYSIAATPANTRARMTAVKQSREFTKRELEAILCDAGLSRKQAAAFISEGFGGMSRDAATVDEKQHSTQPAGRGAVDQRDAVTTVLYAPGRDLIADLHAASFGR